MNPFAYLNSINQTKTDIMEEEKTYNAYMVNRGLSYFKDTILYANLMNQNAHLSPRLQYDFYLNTIRKRKRFSKWFKPEVESDIELIKQVFGYSDDKARNVLDLFNKEQLKEMREKVTQGGTTK
jgi:hypothetical protein